MNSNKLLRSAILLLIALISYSTPSLACWDDDDDDWYDYYYDWLDDDDDSSLYGDYDPNSYWLDEVEVTYEQPYDWGLDEDWWRTDDYWDNFDIDGGNALGEGNEVICYGTSSSGGSGGVTGSSSNTPNTDIIPDDSNTGQGKDNIPSDCDTFFEEFSAAKSEVSNVINKFYNTINQTIGITHYFSYDNYMKMVHNDKNREYTTLLVEYEDYGIMLTVPEPGTETEGPFNYTPDYEYYRAIIHNHPNASALSAQDIISLLTVYFNGCKNTKTIISWNTENKDYYYCATITADDKARSFYHRFQNAVDENNHNWVDKNINKFIRSHEKELDRIEDSWGDNIGDLFRLQAVLDHYDAGISLTTIRRSGGQNNISSVKTYQPDGRKKLQFVRCGDIN